MVSILWVLGFFFLECSLIVKCWIWPNDPDTQTSTLGLSGSDSGYRRDDPVSWLTHSVNQLLLAISFIIIIIHSLFIQWSCRYLSIDLNICFLGAGITRLLHVVQYNVSPTTCQGGLTRTHVWQFLTLQSVNCIWFVFFWAANSDR